MPQEISREKDNSFHLDQLPTASCALYEEPLITPINVGNWKLLLEGACLVTDIKTGDKESIPRLPIFITSAVNICAQIDSNESLQVCQRIHTFVFKETILHEGEGRPVSIRSLARAPTNILCDDFVMLVLILYPLILRRIAEIDKTNVISDSCLRDKSDWKFFYAKVQSLLMSSTCGSLLDKWTWLNVRE